MTASSSRKAALLKLHQHLFLLIKMIFYILIKLINFKFLCVITKDVEDCFYCCFVRCATYIVRVWGVPWPINRRNSWPRTVRTFQTKVMQSNGWLSFCGCYLTISFSMSNPITRGWSLKNQKKIPPVWGKVL